MNSQIAALLGSLGDLGREKSEPLTKVDVFHKVDQSLSRALRGLCMLETGIYDPASKEVLANKGSISYLMGGLLHRLMVHKYGKAKMERFPEADSWTLSGYERLRLFACGMEIATVIDGYYRDNHFCEHDHEVLAVNLNELGCFNKQTGFKHERVLLWVNEETGDVTIFGDDKLDLTCAIHGECEVYSRLVKMGHTSPETVFEIDGTKGYADIKTNKVVSVVSEPEPEDAVTTMEELLRTFEGERHVVGT